MRLHQYAAIALVATLVPSAAIAAGDAEHGKIIAKRWCAACHVVSAGQKRASADVPSFFYVARHKSNLDVSSFLTDPHPKMPDMSLTRQEIADLTAYIRSLAPRDGDK
ncbi:c-type cytochrome [Rhodoblastus acidophilus]|uniref:C-type cytochrome n=1 Tax=Candidatus Rhodoblastus alkanivorans TaxID=2954117 RepID=A0ABS9Z888_9HYPH|nr:c-type cytochrome [Candidatus Rhodoblastus alkanivorans]MCI4677920.1 c-type cytochrome [Candidatus Rhodoblastus alkanivorans]MCI4683816.1 c-type cytochrome [Candidatus Rhodoblastus alkanivorans]MDI4641134.1 c-type cytochrome [Rhodoblastus acidophilus]